MIRQSFTRDIEAGKNNRLSLLVGNTSVARRAQVGLRSHIHKHARLVNSGQRLLLVQEPVLPKAGTAELEDLILSQRLPRTKAKCGFRLAETARTRKPVAWREITLQLACESFLDALLLVGWSVRG